ncbi:MAG: alginate lyase family protein [Pseudomonadota bacterium]|nr:alginate lyase family protein [Pseudomonadota bacterium]
MPEQVLADGGHFERSPMYHSIIFEDILDLINICGAYGQDVPKLWGVVVGKMGRWLQVMSHPDGDIALFNDAALEIAAKPEQLFDYLERVTGEIVGDAAGRCFELAPSGYYVMVPGSGERLLVDCGEIGPDYLPGHAHCDTLSFELSLAGRRVVVDSGCGIYVDGKERQYNRGNVGHNTVTVVRCWKGLKLLCIGGQTMLFP